MAHKSNPGTHLLSQLRLANETVQDAPSVLPRIAFKMATGTGKTVVMACLLLYHHFNRSQYRNDPRYADYFGGGPRHRHPRPAASLAGRYPGHQRPGRHRLLPRAPVGASTYSAQLAGLNAKLIITNFHAFEPRQISGNKHNPLDGKIGVDGRKVEAREDMGQMLKRVLAGFKPGRRLLVINDEAHHCSLPRAKAATPKKTTALPKTNALPSGSAACATWPPAGK